MSEMWNDRGPVGFGLKMATDTIAQNKDFVPFATLLQSDLEVRYIMQGSALNSEQWLAQGVALFLAQATEAMVKAVAGFTLAENVGRIEPFDWPVIEIQIESESLPPQCCVIPYEKTTTSLQVGDLLRTGAPAQVFDPAGKNFPPVETVVAPLAASVNELDEQILFQPVCDRTFELIRSGEFDKALRYGTYAADLTAQRYGGEHVQMGIALRNLAVIRRGLKETDIALALYRQSLRILENQGGDPETIARFRTEFEELSQSQQQ